MSGIYLLLGSNIGNRLGYLKQAADLLIQKKINIIDESSIYETEPWGPKNQDWFLNVVLEVNTTKTPPELLTCILEVEKNMGRIRKEKWSERIIDIDLLYYHHHILETEKLTLPHPGIPTRKFTLIPLVEMAPLLQHPVLKKNHIELLAECADTLDCILTDYKL